MWKDKETAVNTIKKYLTYADIVKFSKEEIQMATGIDDTEKAMDSVIASGVSIVLVTDGANGVNFKTQDFNGFVPSITVNAVDTTGAGDIFFGTFLYEMIKNGTHPKEAKFEEITSYVNKAVKLAGLSTLKKGAIPSIPDYNA